MWKVRRRRKKPGRPRSWKELDPIWMRVGGEVNEFHMRISGMVRRRILLEVFCNYGAPSDFISGVETINHSAEALEPN